MLKKSYKITQNKKVVGRDERWQRDVTVSCDSFIGVLWYPGPHLLSLKLSFFSFWFCFCLFISAYFFVNIYLAFLRYLFHVWSNYIVCLKSSSTFDIFSLFSFSRSFSLSPKVKPKNGSESSIFFQNSWPLITKRTKTSYFEVHVFYRKNEHTYHARFQSCVSRFPPY